MIPGEGRLADARTGSTAQALSLAYRQPWSPANPNISLRILFGHSPTKENTADAAKLEGNATLSKTIVSLGTLTSGSR